MTVSVFDLFSIGIGPSSSHTVGPMRAAARFARSLADDGLLDRTTRVRAELFGSLGATGHGHGSYNAVLWGLEGEDPETVDVEHGPARTAEIVESGRLRLDGVHQIAFNSDADLILHRRRSAAVPPERDDLHRVRGATRCSASAPTTPSAAASSSTTTGRASRS